jgi:hypothetical protein
VRGQRIGRFGVGVQACDLACGRDVHVRDGIGVSREGKSSQRLQVLSGEGELYRWPVDYDC